jgi:hypothetical protein
MCPPAPPRFLTDAMTPLPCRIILGLFLLVLASTSISRGQLSISVPTADQSLTDDQATSLARLAVSGLQREFPNKPANVITSPETILGPKQMHPAFYGCYDWHSSVHGHWMLVRLLKSHPNHPLASESRQSLSQNLTKQNLIAEANYFDEKENKSFERMYGWAWLLKLVTELDGWDDPQGRQWRENLRPLETKIVMLTKGYLPRLAYPIRTGVHPDSAFALGLAWDYAKHVGDRELEDLITDRARHYYLQDRNYNSRFEPSGEDFFSQSLNEADLMRRILPSDTFARWLQQFVPNLVEDPECNLLKPVAVSDVTDGKLVHLAGLNLSRAWCLKGIAKSLPEGAPGVARFRESAALHLQAGLSYVFSGHYEGEHWLGTFAVHAMLD